MQVRKFDTRNNTQYDGIMENAVLNKFAKKTTIDRVNPHLEHGVTLEEYRKEMKDAENSGFISFETHKKNMNQWLSAKL